MRLKRFNSSKKRKLIIGILAIGIILGTIIGYSYYTYAFFNTSKEFNVINGTVPEFKAGDIRLAYTINGKNVSGIGFPNKDYGFTVNDVQCENGVSASWNESEWSLKLIETNKQDLIKCSIDFITPTMSDYLINLSKKDTSIILQEHEETEQTSTFAQTDYRYIGENPNNYVCLEADGTCEEDELYRIIGVIPTQSSENGPYENRVKLIKLTDYVGQTAGNTINSKSGYGYSWTGNYDIKENDWSKSELNTKILNEEYWTKISAYQKYIGPAKWYLGGVNSVSTMYIYIDERKLDVYDNVSRKTSVITNIGLIYMSDYGFATNGGDSIDRNTCLSSNLNQFWHNNRDCSYNDWISDGYIYWTLDTPYNDFVNGYLFQDNMWTNASYSVVVGIRPSFYLKSSVKYLTGDGTLDNPYQIMVD